MTRLGTHLNGLLEHYQRSAVVGLHGRHYDIQKSHHGAAHRYQPHHQRTGRTVALARRSALWILD